MPAFRLFYVMTLIERFEKQLIQFGCIDPAKKQLVAVSGGIDSVVLCDLLFTAKYDFVIAHCNFQLRGAESERDEIFVRSLGEKYGKAVLVERFETEKLAVERKLSIQVLARELRYHWFNSILEIREPSATGSEHRVEGSQKNVLAAAPLQYIVTAHHANDSIETMLMNFFKGTGITGLHGILPLQGRVFRPLLFAKKEELLEYAKHRGLSFVEDSSNRSDKYTRNFFRHELFPLLKQKFPNVEDNLINNIGRFAEIETLYMQSILLHKKKLLEAKGNEIHIPVLKLKKTAPVASVMYEITREYGFSAHQLNDLVGLLESETGKSVSSGSHTIFRNRSWLIISPKQSTNAANILVSEKDKDVTFEQGLLSLKSGDKQSHFQIPADPSIATVDLAKISFPLLLRKWKQGDYFYPLGMKKKKKLSRFLSDQKVSKTSRENTWVLEMDKKIVWIVGHRIDDRFKIVPSTQMVLTISFKKAGIIK